MSKTPVGRKFVPSASVVYMVAAMLVSLATGWLGVVPEAAAAGKFHLQDATIADIQRAILSKEITSTELVKLYLNRIKAYNGTCVKEPQGMLGPIDTIAHAGQINALITLNLRPATRKSWGFDDRKARSMTDPVDNDPNMPDALGSCRGPGLGVREDGQAGRSACMAS